MCGSKNFENLQQIQILLLGLGWHDFHAYYIATRWV